MARRGLLALIVYVTLDLCLPTMPGALGIDLTESADSISADGINVARIATNGASIAVAMRLSAAAPAVADDVLDTEPRLDRPACERATWAPGPIVPWLARVARAPCPSFEDPH
jgi:hypothetical protein